MGEGYLCVVILHQGCLRMQRQLLKQVTVMWAAVAAACPNFCLQRAGKRFSMLQPLGGTIWLLPQRFLRHLAASYHEQHLLNA